MSYIHFASNLTFKSDLLFNNKLNPLIMHKKMKFSSGFTALILKNYMIKINCIQNGLCCILPWSSFKFKFSGKYITNPS